MDLRLRGKRALVTGSSRGIGRAIALSLAETERPDFREAAHIASELVARLHDVGLPEQALLNVNIPGLPRDEIEGVRVTHQSRTGYNDLYEKRVDPWGRTYYWITGELQRHYENEPDSDMTAPALRSAFV